MHGHTITCILLTWGQIVYHALGALKQANQTQLMRPVANNKKKQNTEESAHYTIDT